MVFLGWFIGTLFFGYISDKFGRRKVLLVSMLLMSVCGVASSFAGVFWLFCLLKVFVGAGIGKCHLQFDPSLKGYSIKSRTSYKKKWKETKKKSKNHLHFFFSSNILLELFHFSNALQHLLDRNLLCRLFYPISDKSSYFKFLNSCWIMYICLTWI